MMWAGEQWLAYGKIINASAVKQHLCEVKAGEIRRVAQEYFRPDRLSLAMVSPRKSEAGLARLLKI